ncbi:MAG: hypothetical protein LBC88_10415 [Spirochaetaceae bacterium]|jgi:hypothetical protein|nr:hypothetical protein [Spirochaetaceae bacterium]
MGTEKIIRGFSRFFWGAASPLSTLAGAGLLVMASARTAYALITLGALVWVYTLSALIITLAGTILPVRGRYLAVLGVSSALGGIYLLIIELLNPLLALESVLYIALTPVVCHIAGVTSRIMGRAGEEKQDTILSAFLEALVYGALLVALALARELLGLGTISFPGGSGGIVELFPPVRGLLVPVRVLDSSAGAFLLLGYGIAFFNRLRARYAGPDLLAGEEKP